MEGLCDGKAHGGLGEGLGASRGQAERAVPGLASFHTFLLPQALARSGGGEACHSSRGPAPGLEIAASLESSLFALILSLGANR